jgi:hypothetical protein
MGNSLKIVCKQCGTTNYGVLYTCLKCGAALADPPDGVETLKDFPPDRYDAETIIDYPPDQAAFIEIIDGPDTGNHYALSSGTTFGRSKNCDIVIDTPKVSREHAKIIQNEYLQWLLVDLESMNGTILNSRRITKPTVLYNGDEFRISDSSFRITIRKPYLREVLKAAKDQATGDPEQLGLKAILARKPSPSSTALIILLAILLAAVICTALYFGWEFLTEQGILQPLS